MPEEDNVNDGEAMSEGSDTEGSEENDELESQIGEVSAQLEQNPYHYESHVKLIELLEKAGEFDKLLEARENMAKIFPLTPELWLSWIQHTVKFCETSEEKEKKVIPLFERAVSDYSSVSLWLEYATFCIGLMGQPKGVERVRSVFERAVTAVGLHVTEGALVWETYREFEATLLTTMKKDSEDESEREAYSEQRSRVYNLFKRQLSVPLRGMESTMKELETFSESVDPSVQKSFVEAKKKLQEIEKDYESKLPEYSVFISYLDYEIEKKDPARIQCLFERAVLQHPLVAELWEKYGSYLDLVLKIPVAALPVHRRAVRNCPWSAQLWVALIESQERCGESTDKVTATMEEALAAGLSSPKDFERIWLAYTSFERRRRCPLDANSGSMLPVSEADANILRSCFERAKNHLAEMHDPANDIDVLGELLRRYAILEARFLKNLAKAREIWNVEITRQGSASDAQTWLDFANFERAYGDDKHYRKVLQRGMYASVDWPEVLGDEWLRFEAREGSSLQEHVDVAREKYQAHMKRVNEKRQKAAAREAAKADEAMESKKQNKFGAKRKQQNDGVSQNGDGDWKNKRPQQQNDSRKRKIENTDVFGNPKKSKDDDVFAKPDMSRSKPEAKSSSRLDTSEAHGVIKQPDDIKEQQTVFLSNLAYEVQDDQILDIFKDVGEVEELRLVRDYKGRSKGFGYLVFKSMSSVNGALKKDRTPIEGRPLFISRCNERKQFSFTTGLEKNKLFIRNIPPSVSQEELHELFKEQGECEVRLCTYRNGKSKGMAYVEYKNETTASVALVRMDGYNLKGKILSVAISNPPSRSRPTPSSSAGGGGANSSSASSRIASLGAGPRDRSQAHARTKLSFVPRSVQLQQKAPSSSSSSSVIASQSADSSSSEAKTLGKPMSNADFRSMLLKK